MRPLRIIHALTHSNVTRGGAIQALLLARAQQARGHEVRVVCNARPRRPLDPTFQRWIDAGIPIEPYKMNHITELRRFRRMLQAFDPDVVHAHRDDALRFVFFSTLFSPFPRAFISQRGTTHPFRTRAAAYCHRSPRVHRIIAVAHAVKNSLVSFGVPSDRVEVVYGSFDLERFSPQSADRTKVRNELGLSDDQKLVVQVGALHKKKAPWDFLYAAAEVLKERPDTRFALIGDGKQRKRCEKLLEDLGIADRMTLLGFRTDIADVYAAADVAVIASTGFEGLTGALREALAMTRPVVATEVDGNPEAVKDRQTGLLVPPRDPVAIAKGIVTLLDDPELGRSLGEAGRQLVLENMHEDVRLRRTEEVYNEVLSQNGLQL